MYFHCISTLVLPSCSLKLLTLGKGDITLLTEACGTIREPQASFRQQEHLSVQTEFHRNWVTHLRKDTDRDHGLKHGRNIAQKADLLVGI